MNAEAEYMMNLRFRMKVLSSEGSAFEELFSQVMYASDNSFQQVKPQGQLGDRKNDGFVKNTGTYYQVYAPADLFLSDENAVKKLQTDFIGLLNYWPQNGFTVKVFRYAVNDKFKGCGPATITEIEKLAQQNPSIDIALFTSNNLLSEFKKLRDEDKIEILGPNPSVSQDYFDFEVMQDVVNHIMHVQVNPFEEKIPLSPNFQKKLNYNNLSESIQNILKNAFIKIGFVDEYFSVNLDFQKEELRCRMNSLYQEAWENIEDNDTKADQVFMKLFYLLCPKKQENAVNDAIFALMAYYFGTCDIFEVPPEV